MAWASACCAGSTSLGHRSGAEPARPDVGDARAAVAPRSAVPPQKPCHPEPPATTRPLDALPLEDLAYDPESMPPPPAARGPHPLDEAHDDSSVGHDVLPAAEPSAQPADTHHDIHDSPAIHDSPDDASSPEADDARTDSGAEPEVAHAPEPPAEDQAPARSAAGSAKKAARRSVPSWDDVMFGAKPRD